MKGSTEEVRDEQERALVLARQIADLLNEMDRIDPGRTAIGAGRITGPELEIRRIGGVFTVRS